MKNQKPFMFLTRSGLYAEVKLHDLETGESKTLNSETECSNSHELNIYRSCVESQEVISMGKTIAEPIA
jgi:hypothetical protein